MNRRDFIKGLFATAAYTVVAPHLPQTPNGVRLKASSSLQDLIDQTLLQYRKVLADNITSKSVLWTHLVEKGYVNELRA